MIGSAWRQIRDCMLRQRNLHQPHDKHAEGWVVLEVELPTGMYIVDDPPGKGRREFLDWRCVGVMFQLFEDRVPTFRLSMLEQAEAVGIHVGSFKPVSPVDDFTKENS